MARPRVQPCEYFDGRSPITGQRVGSRHRWPEGWGKGRCRFCFGTLEEVRIGAIDLRKVRGTQAWKEAGGDGRPPMHTRCRDLLYGRRMAAAYPERLRRVRFLQEPLRFMVRPQRHAKHSMARAYLRRLHIKIQTRKARR